MANTAREIIVRAYSKIGLVKEGATAASTSQEADGLIALQDMIDSWSCDRELQHATVEGTFNTANGTASYNIKSGGTWNTSTPITIDSAYITVSNEAKQVEVKREREFYKTQNRSASGRPTSLYFKRTSDVDGTVYVHPVPTATESLTLVMLKPIVTFTAVTDTFALPKGYRRAMVLNLALDLADDYGVQPSQRLVDQAALALQRIREINSAIDMAGYTPDGPKGRGMVVDAQSGG